MLKNAKWLIVLNVGSTLEKFIETAAFQLIFPTVDYVSTFTQSMCTYTRIHVYGTQYLLACVYSNGIEWSSRMYGESFFAFDRFKSGKLQM